jgi:hypothetical protein
LAGTSTRLAAVRVGFAALFPGFADPVTCLAALLGGFAAPLAGSAAAGFAVPLTGRIGRTGSDAARRVRVGAAVGVVLLDIACSERVTVAGCRLIGSTPVRT